MTTTDTPTFAPATLEGITKAAAGSRSLKQSLRDAQRVLALFTALGIEIKSIEAKRYAGGHSLGYFAEDYSLVLWTSAEGRKAALAAGIVLDDPNVGPYSTPLVVYAAGAPFRGVLITLLAGA